MAKIRHLKIQNFRAFKNFEWRPRSGLNCIIGPGDSGKSTIIEAIDLALGPRQTKLFSDVDFHLMNTEKDICIEVTVGDLADPLKNYEKYDVFLRGFDLETGLIDDEPADGLETVLTVRLTIGADLDPVWSLYSERAAALGREKSLSWGDRVLLAGTRIGTVSDYHLSWRKGAVLNRIGDEKPNTTSAIAEAKRAARKAFSEGAQPDLNDVLEAVSDTAEALGVPVEGELQALLNAHSISLSGGTISVHDQNGLPLSSLGLGSSRLLVAGLLDKAKVGSNLILVDELEHGLEPHRIIRFLDAIGAKDPAEKTQSFVTSHSPVVLRELNQHQLFKLQTGEDEHTIVQADIDEYSQGALRGHAECFLAKSVVLCEGASEVGFLRGLDQYRLSKGRPSILAKGVSFLNAGGVSKLYHPAETLQSMGYRVSAFRDDDQEPNAEHEEKFIANGGEVFFWSGEQKIEAAIISATDCNVFGCILELAENLVGADLVDAHIKSASDSKASLEDMKKRAESEQLTTEDDEWLIAACTTKANPWFKNIGNMEALVATVIGPNFKSMKQEFRDLVKAIIDWAKDD